jgi:hypothetical protein
MLSELRFEINIIPLVGIQETADWPAPDVLAGRESLAASAGSVGEGVK